MIDLDQTLCREDLTLKQRFQMNIGQRCGLGVVCATVSDFCRRELSLVQRDRMTLEERCRLLIVCLPNVRGAPPGRIILTGRIEDEEAMMLIIASC